MGHRTSSKKTNKKTTCSEVYDTRVAGGPHSHRPICLFNSDSTPHFVYACISVVHPEVEGEGETMATSNAVVPYDGLLRSTVAQLHASPPPAP